MIRLKQGSQNVRPCLQGFSPFSSRAQTINKTRWCASMCDEDSGDGGLQTETCLYLMRYVKSTHWFALQQRRHSHLNFPGPGPGPGLWWLGCPGSSRLLPTSHHPLDIILAASPPLATLFIRTPNHSLQLPTFYFAPAVREKRLQMSEPGRITGPEPGGGREGRGGGRALTSRCSLSVIRGRRAERTRALHKHSSPSNLNYNGPARLFPPNINLTPKRSFMK